MRPTGRRRLLALGTGAPLLLGGCAKLLLGGQSAPPSEYRLTPKLELPANLPKVDWVLIIAEPTAEGAIESTRIAILVEGRIDRLAGAVWSDRPSAMLQFAMVQAFQSSGKVKAVGTDRDDLPGRYQLQSTLDAFHLEPEAAGHVAVVSLHVRLLGLPAREVAGGQRFTRRVAATAATNDAAVTAFDEAVAGVLDELVAWTLRAGRSSRG
jgi:cholesterol transport system auxiliary component